MNNDSAPQLPDAQLPATQSDAHAAAEASRSAATSAWYRRKSTVVFSTLIFAGALLGAATQTWFQVSMDQGTVRATEIAVPGTKVSAAVTAFALVAAAGALAVTIAGRVGRVIAGVLVLLAAVGAAWTTGSSMLDPQAAVAPAVSEQIGVEGLALDAQLTPLLPLAFAAALCLLFAALAILVFGSDWTSTRKYNAARQARPGANGAASTSTGAVDDLEEFDQIDGWDRLSRGEDPTVAVDEADGGGGGGSTPESTQRG